MRFIKLLLFYIVYFLKLPITKSKNLEISNNKLCVAHFFAQLEIGGIQKTLVRFLEKLINKNVEVILLTYPKKSDEFKLSNKIKRFEIFPSHDINNIDDREYAKKIIEENKINIFVNHANFGIDLNTFMHDLGLKVIFFSHNTFINRSFKYRKDTLEKKNYDLFVSFLNFNMLYISDIHNFKNTLVVTNTLTMEKNNTSRSLLDNKTILMIGRPHFQKNYEFALDVLSNLIQKDKDIKLLLVGFDINKNGYTKFLYSKSKKLNLINNIIFVGSTFDTEQYYRNSSIYLMCSHFEGCANVVTEAKIHGLATIVAGPIYIPAAKKGTINIRDYNITKVAEEILRLFNNKTYLKQMGEYAYNNSILVSDEELIERWIEIYKAVLFNDIQKIYELQKKYNDYSLDAYKELAYMLNQEIKSIKEKRVGYGGEKKFEKRKSTMKNKKLNIL